MKAILITITLFILMAFGMAGYIIGVSQCTGIPNSITKQETDERGLISVQYVKEGKDWALDYLTKKEYDSLFYNFVNYRP